ncbi:MAG TPA: hypothetical protein DCR20_11815 [Planctomycetaceae bacterium]|nr:hypothetical protein [Planctomycetaceae bacterium]
MKFIPAGFWLLGAPCCSVFRKPLKILFFLSFLIGIRADVQVAWGAGWIDFRGSGRYGLNR